MGHNERVIETLDDVAEGAAWLGLHHPAFQRVLDEAPPLELRRRPDGFGGLLSAIISQQVSVASANAIWRRLEGAGLTARAAMAKAEDEPLRAAGLSRQKQRYARALAQSDIDFDALRRLPQDEVESILVAVPGIGRWTAEIYLMFALGRADVFAPGDLALQEAARLLFALPERPNERALRKLSDEWRPWRSIAARALWAYYALEKSREGIR